MQRSREQSANRDAPLVIVIGERGHEQLRGLVRLDLRRGQIVHNRVEERLQVHANIARRKGRAAQDGIGVDDREFRLLVRCAEVNE